MGSVNVRESYVEKFGTYRPGFWIKSLIECSRRFSYSPYLKLFSSLCRKMLLSFFIKGPIDYDFSKAHVRFQPIGNLSEKRCLLKPAAFDPIEIAFIQAMLPDGGVFLDIGANVGLYSLAAASACGKNGRILSFEPNPSVYERLLCNISLNRERDDMAEIIPIQLAITDQNGFLQFAEPENNQGEGRIVESADLVGNSFFKVRVAKLHDVLSECTITRVDVMKIDIEGHEMKALRPFFAEAQNSLYPDYLMVERGDSKHWEELFRLCQGAGYTIYKSCHMNVILKKI